MEGNVAELERRYQALRHDFEASNIDEAMFIEEVDKLQFRDDWGRYWMLGAQTGAWHYYDGQTWHQADPQDADKLPFMDDQGRYWQKGVKSGDWYCYDNEAGEWVKPGEGDPSRPTSVVREGQWPGSVTPQPQTHHFQPQNVQPAPATPELGQFENGLFQDDDGRYWAIGAKSQQWYFYDEDGWHSAQEFYARTGIPAQSSGSTAYTPQSAYQQPYDSRAAAVYQGTPARTAQGGFQPQAQHSDASRQSIPLAQAQPNQPYIAPAAANPQSGPVHPEQYQQPSADYTAPYVENRVSREQPVQPYSVQPPSSGSSQGQSGGPTQPVTGSGVEQMPAPPPVSSHSGTWFYFDGKQWLQYSSGEPAEESPPDPKMILEQESKASSGKSKSGSESEPVVAELFEDDEPPVEVVDVEVITVVEAEPEPEFEPTPEPEPKPEAEPQPVETPPLPRRADEVRPRRSKTSSMEPVGRAISSDEEIERRPRRNTADDPSRPVQPGRRMTPDPSRPITPRKRAAQEPTIAMPIGAASPGKVSAPSAKVSRPSKPVQPDPRRAREATMPMPPVPAARVQEKEEATPSTPSVRHRQVTQAMPKVSPTPRPATSPKPVQQARSPVKEVVETPAPAPVPVVQPQPKEKPETEEGYTFGDVLRSFPSTLWAGVAGIAVMIIFAVIIIIAVNYGSSLFGVEGVAAGPSPTPTLANVPDQTPTPGPTTIGAGEPVATPTAASMVKFSSQDLDVTLEYPENWDLSETSSRVIFSPSEEGFELDELSTASMRIALPDDDTSAISDLLTEALAGFPADAETLNEGTISIASQTWTSTQIRFEDASDDPGIATLAVTNRDGQGYILTAVAPAEEWNSAQPVFQAMINSFKFGAETLVAEADEATTTPRSTSETTAAPEEDEEEEEDEPEETPTPRPSPTPTPTPEAQATPLVYRIQPGDTLLGIAVRFGVDMDLLAQENGISNPEALQVDQELIIPFTAEELADYNRRLQGDSSPGTSSSNSTSSASSASDVIEDSDAGETEATPADSTATGATSASSSSGANSSEVEESSGPASEPAPVSGRIVYPAYNPGINSYDIWMVDLATGEQTPIAGNASQPAFNRDGTLLAYRSWERSTRGIFFRDFVGGRGGMVTRFVEDGLPTWSPDGYSFTFASRKEGDRVPRVYIGNQMGEETFAVGFQGEYPDSFPDGRLVVKGCTASGDCGLFVIGPRGGGEKKISGEVGDTAPAGSPDGTKIAFMSSGRGARNWEIWVMNADGSNAKQLTENGSNDGLPTWSPDGNSIAYVSDQGGVWAVWVMNADGSNQRKLFDMKGSPDGNVLHDESNSRGWLEERISWAP